MNEDMVGSHSEKVRRERKIPVTMCSDLDHPTRGMSLPEMVQNGWRRDSWDSTWDPMELIPSHSVARSNTKETAASIL